MESNNIFSLNRFFYLIKRHYVLNYKGLLIAFFAIAGVLAIIGALGSIGSQTFNHDALVSLFYVVLFIGGYIYSAGIFHELHRPERSLHFLTLPASSFEKLLNGWINTTVLYLVFSFIIFYISYFLSSLMAFWWFEIPLEGFNIFQAGFLKACVIYSVTQSVFFFGAIYFKGFNFLKTILFLFILFLVHSMYQTIISAVTFREILIMAIQNRNVEDFVSAPGLEVYMKEVFVPVVKVLFYYVLPVFFLTLSYIRIKEREV